jgi:predicted transcriptional regulator
VVENTKLLSLQFRSKRPYRAGTGIMMDILNIIKDCGMQGAKISEIARKANLSHYATLEKCQKMIDAELLRSIQDRRNHMYVITEKGIRFRQNIEEFLALVQSIGIRI